MPTERTLALLKPDATARPIVGAIVAMAEEAGLRVAAARMGEFGPAAMEDLYAEHAGRPYFADQIAYMVSGPVLALVLEGPDAVATWRGVMGPTDREKAPEGTVRRRFAESFRRNSVHGSDSVANAEREIAVFFPDAVAAPGAGG
jgi:nucleoside-diphosphate kinase